MATLYFIYFLIGVLNEVEQWKIADDNVIDRYNELHFLAKKGGKFYWCKPHPLVYFSSKNTRRFHVKRSLGWKHVSLFTMDCKTIWVHCVFSCYSQKKCACWKKIIEKANRNRTFFMKKIFVIFEDNYATIICVVLFMILSFLFLNQNLSTTYSFENWNI